jgi:hypothetical protein
MIPVPTLDFSTRKALLFALVAERLSSFYEHGEWMSVGQGATLASSWMARSKARLAPEDGRLLARLSDEFARHLATNLSREAGLFTAHEMMEALDPRYFSEHAEALLAECERLLLEQAPELG